MTTINTLSDSQLEQFGIDREEAALVLEFYNEFSEGLWDVDRKDVDTVTILRTSDDGVPEVAYVIYKDLKKNREMVNYYEDARQVMYNMNSIEDGEGDEEFIA